jgi:hypothetical protein
MTAMTTTSPIDPAERARRAEMIRDWKGAVAHRETFEVHAKKREDKADSWAGWFRRKMDEGGITDPVVLLPDAFARLEQLAEDRIAAAMNEFKTVLRGALK